MGGQQEEIVKIQEETTTITKKILDSMLIEERGK